jgi:hypothetical protein
MVVKKPILIDEATRMELDETIPVELLGGETFKGKTIAVQVYSVNDSTG